MVAEIFYKQGTDKLGYCPVRPPFTPPSWLRSRGPVTARFSASMRKLLPMGRSRSGSIRILQFVVSWRFCFVESKLSLGREGFEPSKVKPADLQSALVGHLSTYPKKLHGAA